MGVGGDQAEYKWSERGNEKRVTLIRGAEGDTYRRSREEDKITGGMSEKSLGLNYELSKSTYKAHSQWLNQLMQLK